MGRVLLIRDHSMTSGTLSVTHGRPRLGLSLAFVRRTTVLRSVNVFVASTSNVFYFNGCPCVYRKCLNSRLITHRNCPHRTLIYRHRANTKLSLGTVVRHSLPIPRHRVVPVDLRRRVVYFTSGFCSGAGLSGRGDIRGTQGDVRGRKRRKLTHFST